ncbi:unnamed protein product [Miscanthus lutarioriparius]|uniref:Uncharacterized protein n=1 Tax=Miscanthus lutarioriparius TaxID=422564 RepID=A0A811MVE5_9POAL|nr:unnamed protein product [Miscanthus lutarioriparius]
MAAAAYQRRLPERRRVRLLQPAPPTPAATTSPPPTARLSRPPPPPATPSPLTLRRPPHRPAAGAAISAPQPPAPAPAPAPAPLPLRPSSPPSPAPAPTAEPYDYEDALRHQPLYPTPEVFRGWPFLPPPPVPHCRCRSACACACARARHRDYWRQCMRGLDFLFGHCDGYGERRIGVDSSSGSPSTPTGRGRRGRRRRRGGAAGHRDCAVARRRPGAVSEQQEETHSYEQTSYTSYDRSYEQPTYTSYDRSYEQPTYASYDRPYEQPTYASYDRPYEQPTYTSYDGSYEQHNWFHGVPDETTWFPNQRYQDVYREEESQYQEFLSYDEDSKISSQPIFSYNQHFGEQPLHIHVEPPETVSSHKLEYYENFSTYNSQNDVDNLESSRQSYETQPYVHMPYDQLEPYRPSWSLNSGYYQACTEGITPEYDNHTLASDECWDMSSLFMSPFYPQETRSYEQSHGDENV